MFSGGLGRPDCYGPDDYSNSISWKAAIHSDTQLRLGKPWWTENVQNNKTSFHEFLEVGAMKMTSEVLGETAQNAWFWAENRKVVQTDAASSGRTFWGRTRLTSRIKSWGKHAEVKHSSPSLKNKSEAMNISDEWQKYALLLKVQVQFKDTVLKKEITVIIYSA